MRFEKFPTWVQWEMASTTTRDIRFAKPVFGVQLPFGRANKAKVLEIDDLVKRYHLVFDISKLNILMRLRDTILDWSKDKVERDASTGRLLAMQALLDVTLRTITDMDGWGNYRYVKAVCIGYEVPTGEYDPSWMPKNSVRREKIDEADVATSCARLIGAIQGARGDYDNYVAQKKLEAEDEKTLKIFMAPEFYFRGRYGAYQDVGLCSKILATMREEIKKSVYKDWLFVCGTAIFASESEGGGMFLENYALVQKGGIPNRFSDVVVAKEFPSHIDFQRPINDVLPWYEKETSEALVAGKVVKHLSPVGGRRDPLHEHLTETPRPKKSELAGGVVFTMDSIMFGLEVCRDHLVGRLAHSKDAGKPLIQLIPSGGAAIDSRSVGCKTGGIVFNVDGLRADSEVKVNNTPIALSRIVTYKNDIIKIYLAQDIPWPEVVKPKVAQHLDITEGALRGLAPPRRVA
jgi:hypothetical protein